MLAGMYAARNLTGDRRDVWSVNTDAEYQEHVVMAPLGDERRVPQPVRPTALAADPIIRRAFAPLDPVALGVAVAVVCIIGLAVATAGAMLQPSARLNLTLASQYLLGFALTGRGILIGAMEAGAGGFVFGYAAAALRNEALHAYAVRIRRRARAELQLRALDDV